MMAEPTWLINDVNKTLGDSRPHIYSIHTGRAHHELILLTCNASLLGGWDKSKGFHEVHDPWTTIKIDFDCQAVRKKKKLLW